MSLFYKKLNFVSPDKFWWILAICNINFSHVTVLNRSKEKTLNTELAVASQKLRNLANTTEDCMEYTF